MKLTIILLAIFSSLIFIGSLISKEMKKWEDEESDFLD